MASGSQTNSGICADLPVAPTKSSSVIRADRRRADHLRVLLQLGEIECPNPLAAQLRDQQKNSQDETEIADAIDDERFVAGDAFVWILVPKTDQKIRAKTDAFPADEQQQQIVGHDQQQA